MRLLKSLGGDVATIHSADMQGETTLDSSSQDNAVSYELYLRPGTVYYLVHARDKGVVPSQTLFAGASLDEVQNAQLECMAIVSPYLTDYIWQQDPFSLRSSAVVQSPWSKVKARGQRNQKAEPVHLWGFARFGDNIEDEWFIVWLLCHITLKVSTALSYSSL